jgi:hypothetical protein
MSLQKKHFKHKKYPFGLTTEDYTSMGSTDHQTDQKPLATLDPYPEVEDTLEAKAIRISL